MINIIIPVFNNQDTIEKAIDSVISQTYKDWEIIIVNDKSTDNTIEIIKQYQEKYPRKIKIINNSENQGVGISRINGVKEATGEFLTFLDSDDYLLPDYLEISKLLQEQHNSDVVYSGIKIIWNEKEKIINTPNLIMTGKISPSLHINFPKKWLTGKLFRTELMKKTPMSPKRIGEDVNTLFYSCYLADKVRSTEYIGYVHVYRENSLIGLGTDRPFYYYCLSTILDIEMIEFIIKQKDKTVYTEMIKIPSMNYKRHKGMLQSKQISEKEYRESYHEWNYISNWFEKELKNPSLK